MRPGAQARRSPRQRLRRPRRWQRRSGPCAPSRLGRSSVRRLSPMENPGQRAGAASSLVAILRKITRIVQIAPFAYLLLLGAILLCESVLPDWALRLASNALDAPIYTTAAMLFFGRILKLCSWFRTACLLPFATKVEGYVDSFVYTLTQNEVVVVNSVLGIVFLVFICVSFRHFFHGRNKA